MKSRIYAGAATVALAAMFAVPVILHRTATAAGGVPKFQPDPYWPKPLLTIGCSAYRGDLRGLSRPHLGRQPSEKP